MQPEIGGWSDLGWGGLEEGRLGCCEGEENREQRKWLRGVGRARTETRGDHGRGEGWS